MTKKSRELKSAERILRLIEHILRDESQFKRYVLKKKNRDGEETLTEITLDTFDIAKIIEVCKALEMVLKTRASIEESTGTQQETAGLIVLPREELYEREQENDQTGQ